MIKRDSEGKVVEFEDESVRQVRAPASTPEAPPGPPDPTSPFAVPDLEGLTLSQLRDVEKALLDEAHERKAAKCTELDAELRVVELDCARKVAVLDLKFKDRLQDLTKTKTAALGVIEQDRAAMLRKLDAAVQSRRDRLACEDRRARDQVREERQVAMAPINQALAQAQVVKDEAMRAYLETIDRPLNEALAKVHEARKTAQSVQPIESADASTPVAPQVRKKAKPEAPAAT
jgi:hypothetical protein